jgi:predicted PurR-regulated permease PerM
MTDPHSSAGGDEMAGSPPPRAAGWQSADVLRTASLVIAMYVAIRLAWFAKELFLVAFLGVLFGLAVAAGTDYLVRLRIPRGLAAGLIVAGFFGLLTGFGFWVAPTLRQQGTELQRRVPESLDRFEEWLNQRRGGVVDALVKGLPTPGRADSAGAAGAEAPAVGGAPAPRSPVARDTAAAITLRERFSQQVSGLAHYLFSVVSSTVAAFAAVFIIIFLSIFIAADPEMYRAGIMQLFPHRSRQRAGEVLSAMAAMLRRWLVTQLIAMAVIGAVSTIVLLILDVKAAFALGVLAGLFEFIPTIGPILSAIPAIAMGFLDSPEKAFWVMLAYIGVQFLENHLLIPLLMKGGIDLPPALTILSQALMALLSGFLGLMCAVPLLAATMVGVRMLYVEDVVGDPAFKPGEDPARGIQS